MWYIVSFIFSLLLGVYFYVLCIEYSTLRFLTTSLSALLIVYALIGTGFYSSRMSYEEDYERYLKAKCELEILKTDAQMTYSLVQDFKKDIDEINKRIERSRKYKGHWYLHGWYNPGTAELECLHYDTVNVKVIM